MIRYSFQIVLFAGIVLLMPGLLDAAQPDAALYPSIEGWKRSDSIRVFTPDNLYNFIDGAADAYLMQDFERLTVAYYTRGDTSVTVEIYKHRTEENAYGMYIQERSAPISVLPIGIEGYYAETVLNFVIGRTYVKLTSYTLGSREKDGLEQIARKVAGAVGGTTTPPPLFGCFPKDGLIAGSEKFVGKDFLGYTFFRSGYIADYKFDATSFQMFMIEAPDTLSCLKLFGEYLAAIKHPPFQHNPVRDPYWGSVTLRLSGRMLLGLIGTISPLQSDSLLTAMQLKYDKLRISR